VNPGDYVRAQTREQFWFGWVTGWIGSLVLVQRIDYTHPSGWATIAVSPDAITVVSAVPQREAVEETI
jgi:hypothetical protein